MQKRNYYMTITSVLLIVLVACFGCKEVKKERMIKGMKIVDHVMGDGLKAEKYDVLTVNYTGKLDDGTIFDSSKNPGREPFRFKVGMGQVIQGWEEGFIGMREGGSRTLTIPPEMGYGAQGAGGVIPPNAILIFDVELLKVEKNDK